MDHLIEHLQTRIKETEEATAKYSVAVERSREFIVEFQETDPDTAQIYRDWEAFEQKKVEYFQSVLKDLQDRLTQRNLQLL